MRREWKEVERFFLPGRYVGKRSATSSASSAGGISPQQIFPVNLEFVEAAAEKSRQSLFSIPFTLFLRALQLPYQVCYRHASPPIYCLKLRENSSRKRERRKAKCIQKIKSVKPIVIITTKNIFYLIVVNFLALTNMHISEKTKMLKKNYLSLYCRSFYFPKKVGREARVVPTGLWRRSGGVEVGARLLKSLEQEGKPSQKNCWKDYTSIGAPQN